VTAAVAALLCASQALAGCSEKLSGAAQEVAPPAIGDTSLRDLPGAKDVPPVEAGVPDDQLALDVSGEIGSEDQGTPSQDTSSTGGPCAKAELCNAIDDDCDGETDEDLPLCACGDGRCAADGGETVSLCPCDCNECGDAICSPCGESPSVCEEDCCRTPEGPSVCGDGYCLGYGCGESPGNCPEDCGHDCGNGSCDRGENPFGCPEDCKRGVCGNSVCEPTDGGPALCPDDCSPTCGDCVCERGESWFACPIDCGFCGDGACSECPAFGESADSCPMDCCLAISEVDRTCDGVDDDCDGVTDEDPCDDGDACTSEDACADGVCAGTPISCDDSDPCTDDSCDASTGCVTTPNSAPCDDGELCTSQDACADGVCAGTPYSCDDGLACTDDLCDGEGLCEILPLAGTCLIDSVCHLDGDANPANPCQRCDAPNPSGWSNDDAAACSDGDDCTAQDKCVDGSCVGQPLVDGYEPNNGRREAHSLGLVDDDESWPKGEISASLYAAGDVDWYQFRINDRSMPVSVEPTPRLALTAPDTAMGYDLCAFYDCDDTNDTVFCERGSPRTSGELQGCCDTGIGRTKLVIITPDCVTADETGWVYVEVSQGSGSWTCTPYTLEWGTNY